MDAPEGTLTPGGPLEIAGGGFMADSEIEVWLHSDPVLLGTAVADAVGDFAASLAIPAGTPPGTHEVVALGVDPSGDVLEIHLTVTIASPAPPETDMGATGAALGLRVSLLLAGLGCLLLAATLRRPRSRA